VVKGLALTLALSMGGANAAETVDLARWAAGLPTHWAVHGVKTEPTYEEAVDLSRNGDFFAVTGGAPGWAARSSESVLVSSGGALLRRPCGAAEDCALARPPSGFLAAAALISAQRRGALAGVGIAQPFGARYVLCIDALMLGFDRPILDPCFDRWTGAAIAHRHRLNGHFDGPTLEAYSLRFE
jgi:hypothetical protein